MDKNNLEKKQMRLSKFCYTYDIPRSTVMDWINYHGFPACLINKRWYIDVHKAVKWIEIHSKKYN